MDWPVAADADRLIEEIGAKAYPAMALFDPQGRLADVFTGVGRRAYPDMFDAWLDRKMHAAGQATTAAVVDFRTCPMPIYPIDELRARHTGTVTLNFLVSRDGYIRKAEIKTSSGFPGLDQAAMVSLVRCRFKPAMSAGPPVERWSPVQYMWSIR